MCVLRFLHYTQGYSRYSILRTKLQKVSIYGMDVVFDCILLLQYILEDLKKILQHSIVLPTEPLMHKPSPDVYVIKLFRSRYRAVKLVIIFNYFMVFLSF